MGSAVAEAAEVPSLQHRLNSCSTRASLLRRMWDRPELGIEPVSPVLAGGLFTTEPPGVPFHWNLDLRNCCRLFSGPPKKVELICRKQETLDIQSLRLDDVLGNYKFFYFIGTQHGGKFCKCCLVVWSIATPWIVANQLPLYVRFPRQEYWSGLPFPSSGIFLTQGSNLPLLHWQ